LADKSWLFAFKKDGDWFFNVLTVFPDDLEDVKAGGIIVSEDLLNGKTSFVNYLDNKFISKNEILKVYASSKNKFAKERVKTCRQIWIQYCLDGTEICSSTWKEVCTDDVVDPNFPDFPPFTDGCEGCSSGGRVVVEAVLEERLLPLIPTQTKKLEILCKAIHVHKQF